MDGMSCRRLLCGVLPFALFAAAHAGERTIETVIPALSYTAWCSSTIDVQNLGDRTVRFEIEAHRSSGALIPWTAHQSTHNLLEAGERATYRAAMEESTTAAWVKIRETVPAAASPALAVSGKVECIAGNELRTASREVSYPTRNPWYAGETGAPGGVISLINTSERAARAALCYASRTLFSVPGRTPGEQLQPLCSTSLDAQIPPFGSREFPVEQSGNSYFSIRTQGDSIALQMLRPVEERVNLYSVDSSIVFGGEAQPLR